MRWLVILLALLLSGCSVFSLDVSRCSADGTVCSQVQLKSRMEFENGIQVIYNADTKSYEILANSATTTVSPLEQAAADIVRQAAIIVPTVPK